MPLPLREPPTKARIRKRSALCLVCGNKRCIGYCELLGTSPAGKRKQDQNSERRTTLERSDLRVNRV